MTVINVTAALTALGGSEPVTSGRITVEYLRGKDGEPATRASGAAVTLPAPIVIAIIDGSPVDPVNVPPTDGTCYARVTVTAMKPYSPMPLELPAVAIPATGPVDITALVAVDPASYEPVTSVVTAWQLAVGQVAAMQSDITVKSSQAVEAAADAGEFAGAADFDANRAGESAFQAGQSAASALGHRNAAAESAAAAAAAAGTSLGAAAKNPDLIIVGNITRDANQAVTSADVVWPNGEPGTFTALTLSTEFPGAVDSYRITYGSPVTKTFTQPAITRNSAGAATIVPQIVVS